MVGSIIFRFFVSCRKSCLTDDEGIFVRELVCGDLEVQGSRTLANTTGDVVVRTVAGAEPTAKVTGFADGDTTEVSADTYINRQHNADGTESDDMLWRVLPSITSHSGFWTRSSSG